MGAKLRTMIRNHLTAINILDEPASIIQKQRKYYENKFIVMSKILEGSNKTDVFGWYKQMVFAMYRKNTSL